MPGAMAGTTGFGGGGAQNYPPDNESAPPETVRASEAALGLVALLAAANSQGTEGASSPPVPPVNVGRVSVRAPVMAYGWGRGMNVQSPGFFGFQQGDRGLALQQGAGASQRSGTLNVCSSPGCNTDAKARGLCGKHGA